MITRIVLPRLGDTVDEVVIIEWLVTTGQRVEIGTPLIRVETDKVEVDIESTHTGIVHELFVIEGNEVMTGSALCAIDVVQ